jgi:hypothetical protein
MDGHGACVEHMSYVKQIQVDTCQTLDVASGHVCVSQRCLNTPAQIHRHAGDEWVLENAGCVISGVRQPLQRELQRHGAFTDHVCVWRMHAVAVGNETWSLHC